MVTQGHVHKAPQIEIEYDRKAQREGEKMLRSQCHHSETFYHFATPLAGTYLNLPQEPCLLECPSCGIKDMTRVEEEPQRTDMCFNILRCIFYCCFCCCCTKEKFCCPIFRMVPNHYCQNCGCYFGQHTPHRNYKPKEKTGQK